MFWITGLALLRREPVVGLLLGGRLRQRELLEPKRKGILTKFLY